MSFSGIWKFSLLLNNGEEGHSESHCWQGSTNPDLAIASAQKLAQARAGILGSNVTTAPAKKTLGSAILEFVRCADALNPRNSFLINTLTQPNVYGGPVGSSNAYSDTFQNALSIRMYGQDVTNGNGNARATLQIVGQPFSAIGASTYQPDAILANGANFDDAFVKYLKYLINPSNLLGFVGLSGAAAAAKQQVTAFQVNAGQWQLTVGNYNSNDNMGPGAKFRLTGCNQVGFNGTYKVVPIYTAPNVPDPNNFLLASGPSSTLRAPTTGKVQPVQLPNGTRIADFYAYQPFPQGTVPKLICTPRKHNPGRQFVPVTFHKRTRKPH